MKRIIYQNDENIAIVFPANEDIDINKLAEIVVPKGTQFIIVNQSDIPLDRTFRDSWKINITNSKLKKGSIKIDLEKAKEIWKEKLRKDRKLIFESLDLEVIKKLEDGKDTSVITEKKQKLRDITNHSRFDKVQSVEELKTLTIDILMES